MSERCSTGGGGLSDEDVQRISNALKDSWMPHGGHTHLSDAVMGFVTATLLLGLVWYCFKGYIYRRLLRKEQSFAVEALKDIDKDTLKEVLGNVQLPSWITFPDFERVGWVNAVLEQLWPYVNDAVCSTMRERLDPMLAEQKPSWISSIKLFRFDLGDKPPQANGIKVYKSPAVKEQVIIEADFIWAGNQDVQLNVTPIPKHFGKLDAVGKVLKAIISLRVGTEKLILTGRIRIALKPLLEDLPVVAAIHVAFVEMPKLSLNLTLYGGDMSFLPGLETYLLSFVQDNVLRPYVLPEAYVYPLVDASDMGIEKPQGMLFVKVIEATNVPRMDLFSDSDPFVRMYVRDKVVYKSQVKQNTKHPVWNEDFKFLVHEPEYQSLNAILYDFDSFNSDDEIGRISVPIHDLPHAQKQDLWLDIFDFAKASQADFNEEHIVDGVIGTVRNVKNLTSSAISRFERRLPGIDHHKKCKLHMEATYYKFQAADLDAAEREGAGHTTEDPSLAEAGEEEPREEGVPVEGKADTSESALGKDVVNALKGGVLYVKPRQASHVMHKPWYKGGVLGSTSTCKIMCADYVKYTVTGRGPDPVFSEAVEFLLGGSDLEDIDSHQITIELWDYRLRNSFQGSVTLSLREVIEKTRIKERYHLEGVRHGELAVELQWMSAMAGGG